MHRLRYHSSTPAAPPLAPPPVGPGGPAPADGPPPRRGRPGRRAAVLGVAIAVLLGGGAFAVSQLRADPPTTRELAALARQAVLTVGDFPAGWTADPPEADPGPDQEGNKSLAECLGAPYDDSPNAAAASFTGEGGMSASSEFSIAPTLEWAKAEFATLSDVAAPSCFEKVLRTMLERDKEPGDAYTVKVTRMDAASFVPRSFAPNTAGFRAAITLRRNGLPVPMTFDFILLRHDRVEAMLAFNSLGTTGLPTELMQSLTTAVVDRLQG